MLKSLEYRTLIMIAIILGLAPFTPMPHLFEKVNMLFSGTLHKPIDIFDLFLHSAPLFVLAAKFFYDKKQKKDA